MPLSVWTQPSGYSLGNLSERQSVNINLPVSTTAGITFRVISGALPQGLRLVGSAITGTPYEIVRTRDYNFVIRATGLTGISDRTFKFVVEGADEPNWLTPTGPLPVGTNNAYYVLDSSFIDFQLTVSDTDAAAGQQLSFFIASDEGELPPGLILQPSGRITGFIQPLLEIPLKAGNGSYDSDLFDEVAYDFGYRSSNGYDTYVYDSVFYDFFVATGKPRKLNRNYEFIATVTDGDTVTKRRFRIYVVGDDFFRSDNVVLEAGEGTYTADVTYVRAPIFITPKHLGVRRANNYQTLKIDIYEGFSELGPVVYSLSTVNALIDGVCVKDLGNDNREGQPFIRLERSSGVPIVGYKISFDQEFTGSTDQIYTITEVDVLGGDSYRLTVSPVLEVSIPNATAIYIGTDSVLPPGMQFDISSAEVFGVIPYQPAITTSYSFTVKATRYGQGTETSISRRVFTIGILGEVESVMNWVSPTSLGSIDAGYVSTLFVEATSTIATSAILYTVEDGILPPGLTLNMDGEIVGKVNQLQEQNTYRSFWQPNTEYSKNNLVKLNNVRPIKSVTRTKNTAYVVTSVDHDFSTGDLIEIVSDDLNFNYYSAIEVIVAPIKLESFTSIENTNGSAPYRITFAIPTQAVAPLAPVFTNVSGLSASTAEWLDPVEVEVKSTSGNGTGAVFLIAKGANGTTNYRGLINTANRPITVLDTGTGYLPGDTVTFSGADLPGGGVDGINDLTFELVNGLEFYYKINGNSNANYNGRFFATKSSTSSVTLNFDTNPGTFGSGLISQLTSTNTYEAQTQLTPLNYFRYPNKGTSIGMKVVSGTTYNEPSYYKAIDDHTSSATFNELEWEDYFFPPADKSITTFDGGDLTFDGITSTVDRKYTFTVRARDQLGYSAVTKTFELTVTIPNNLFYSNITARPFLKQSQRSIFKEFVTDPEIFESRYIYRPNDQYFGIQQDLKMLVFAGIETKDAVDYISAIGRNHKTKRFTFGNIKKAVAKIPGTNEVVYEVIYLEMKDPLESDGKRLPDQIKYSKNKLNITVDQNNDFYQGDQTLDSSFWKRPMPLNVTLDRNDIFAGDPETAWRFPSSISLWRYRLRNMPNTSRERNYLPLWMRSIQQGSTQEINYVAAVTLCYCKPGTADEILLNIKNSGFDFKQLDYTIDRYIIDSVTGEYTDKYLVFRNDRTTIT
jgi:hypothetical protein